VCCKQIPNKVRTEVLPCGVALAWGIPKNNPIVVPISFFPLPLSEARVVERIHNSKKKASFFFQKKNPQFTKVPKLKAIDVY